MRQYRLFKKYTCINRATCSVLLQKSIFIACVFFLLSSCGSIPDKNEPEQLTQLEPEKISTLGRIFDPYILDNTGNSGFVLLRDGGHALQERLALADAAEHSIEAQYYIWNSDKSGRLLARKLIQAADRGVSVRIILDDFSVGDRNEQLLALNSHPDIEIRIYNPFINRSGVAKWLNFAFDFDRLNQRMHNKTYTVDAVASIVGGRNIGDEYFNQDEQLNFRDLDLFTVGPVVKQVSQSFHDFWNSPWAIPVDLLTETGSEVQAHENLATLLAEYRLEEDTPDLPDYSESAENYFSGSAEKLIWAAAEFIYDQPGTDDQQAYSEGPKPVAARLLQLTADSTEEILVESAYFVLDQKALTLTGQLREKGVAVRALTNSMASNDVLPNHASYAMVRQGMLESGIELHELRPDAASCLETIGSAALCDEDTFFGLHSKAAVFDHKIVYIGSCNLNLRSAYLNTEVGVFLQSTELAQILASEIEKTMTLTDSWQPVIKNGKLVWLSESDGIEQIITHEPQTSWTQRLKKGILTLVPGAEYY